MQKTIVLDTSLFVNPDAARTWGPTPTAAFTRFLSTAQETKGLTFLMPPSIYRELMNFAEESKITKSLLLIIGQTPPKKHEIKVPGIFLYQLVEDMRDRVDRGLRLAERHAREALQITPPAKDMPKEVVRPDAEIIGRLRESYRRIMREGMLDSRCDVDLLLLAYEAQGTLVSADEGVLLWAENLGVSILPYAQLAEFLAEHAEKRIA